MRVCSLLISDKREISKLRVTGDNLIPRPLFFLIIQISPNFSEAFLLISEPFLCPAGADSHVHFVVIRPLLPCPSILDDVFWCPFRPNSLEPQMGVYVSSFRFTHLFAISTPNFCGITDFSVKLNL